MTECERRIVRAKEARGITGIGKSELYRKSADPDDPFPAAMDLGPHSVGWFDDELLEWRSARPRVVTKNQGTTNDAV